MRSSPLRSVENRLIVELKSVEEIRGIHEAQRLTYKRVRGQSPSRRLPFPGVLALGTDGDRYQEASMAGRPPSGAGLIGLSVETPGPRDGVSIRSPGEDGCPRRCRDVCRSWPPSPPAG